MHGWTAAAAIAMALAGLWLRFWRAGDMLIFADEIHTIECALTKNFLWISTNFTANDACIPLSLYTRMLLEAGWLNELTFRLPSLLAGAALLAVFSLLVCLLFTPFEALLMTGAMALSPYMVYLSREGRPYPIVALLFFMAALCLFAWRRGRGAMYLNAAALLGALAIYFHAVAAPSVGLLCAWPLWAILRGRAPEKAWREYCIFIGIFLLALLLLLGPGMPSFIEQLGRKQSLGRANAETAVHGMMLLLGLPAAAPLWAWILLTAPGMWRIWRRYPDECCCLIAATVVQIAVIFVFQPAYGEIPWVCFRYFAHLHPLLIIAVVLGVSIPFQALGEDRFRGLLAAGAVLLCGLFAFYHAQAGHYSIARNDAFNVHPMRLFDRERPLPIPEFYSRLAALPPGDLIEAPMVMTFPLYGVYGQAHDRQIYAATLGTGVWQHLFDPPARTRLERIFSLENLTAKSAPARYLVIHKKIKEEMKLVFSALMKSPFAATQLRSMNFFFGDFMLELLFGPGDLVWRGEAFGKPIVYQDYWVDVYDLRGTCPALGPVESSRR